MWVWNSLDLVPRRVQQGSASILFVGCHKTKPPLSTCKGLRCIQLRASRYQPVPPRLAKYDAVIIFPGYLVKSSTSEIVQNNVWLPYCVPSLQSAWCRADRGYSAEKATLLLFLHRARQENVLCPSGCRLPCAVPISLCEWSPGMGQEQEKPPARQLLTNNSLHQLISCLHITSHCLFEVPFALASHTIWPNFRSTVS